MMDDSGGGGLASGASRVHFLLEEETGSPAVNPMQQHQHALSPRRYAIALLYGCGNALNAFLWICFAPVVNTTMARFDVGSQAVNMFSIVFLLLYLPGTVLNIFLTERWGLRTNLLAGAGLNLLCAWVRYAGMQLAAPHAQFAVVKVPSLHPGSDGSVVMRYLSATISAEMVTAGPATWLTMNKPNET